MTDLRSLIAAAIAENDSLIIRARRSDRNEVECTVQPRGWDGEDRFFAFNLTNSEYEVFELAEIAHCVRASSGATWTAPRGEAALSGVATSLSPVASLQAALLNEPGTAKLPRGDGDHFLRGRYKVRGLLLVVVVIAAAFFVVRQAPLDRWSTASEAVQTATAASLPAVVETGLHSVCSARHVKCFTIANGVVRLYRLTGSPFMLRDAPAMNAAVVVSTELAAVDGLIARNAAGDWLQMRLRDSRSGWVAAAAVMADGDFELLPIAEVLPMVIVNVDEPDTFTATPIEPLSTETTPAPTPTDAPTFVPTPESTATPKVAEADVQPSEEAPSFELDETVVARVLATQAASGGVVETADTESDGDGDAATATAEPIEAPTATPPEATATPQVTPSPAARNCPRPEVCIVAPPSGAYRRYTDVYFLGTATHPNFQRYKFEAVNLASGAVGTVAEFWKPVPRGELMRFATFSMPPGRYRFRMIVIDNTGNSWPEIAEVDIELQ